MLARVIRFEWGKWRGRPESWWTVGSLLVATAAYGGLTLALQKSGLAPPIPGVNLGEGTGYHLAYQTAQGLYRLLSLFLILWGSTSLVGEVESGTLRMPLLRIPRVALPLGKAAFLSGLAAVIAVSILLLSWILGALGYGLSGVNAGQVELHSGSDLFVSGLFAGLLSILPLISALALGLCASSLLRSVQSAWSLALVVGTVLWVVGNLVDGVGGYVFPATLDWPLNVAKSQAEGLKTEIFADGVLRHIGINLAWIAGLLGLVTLRFSRRDLSS